MSIKRECLDALAYELHLLGFGLEEIQDFLNPQLKKIGTPTLSDKGTPSRNIYFNVAAGSIRRGTSASQESKKWAKRMLPRCLDQYGKLKNKIVLDLGI